MRTYLLDTDTCIFALKGNRRVLAQLMSRSPSAIHISVVTEAELRAGAAKSTTPIKTLRALESFLEPLTVLELTSSDAVVYGAIRAQLERSGTPIGPLDTFIAAHAVARGMALVTHNLREFRRVKALSIETWAK